VLKPARAAFALAATLDPRVAANAHAWCTGLAEIPGAVTARDAVLTDAQVQAVVAASYGISEQFGTYVQVHAEVGARSSQLARLTVHDLQGDRLMVPGSKKGRGGGKPDRTPIPLTPSLAARLKAVAAGRPANAPLLRRPDTAAWRPRNADHRLPFQQAVRAAGLPEGTSIYSLRHSSIARALLRNCPIKIVADWHDTSVGQIERHYGRHIKHHADELMRAVLLDTNPPTPPVNVVPLRG
jgi:integrase